MAGVLLEPIPVGLNKAPYPVKPPIQTVAFDDRGRKGKEKNIPFDIDRAEGHSRLDVFAGHAPYALPSLFFLDFISIFREEHDPARNGYILRKIEGDIAAIISKGSSHGRP